MGRAQSTSECDEVLPRSHEPDGSTRSVGCFRGAINVERPTAPHNREESMVVTNWPVGTTSPAGTKCYPRRGWITFLNKMETSPARFLEVLSAQRQGSFVTFTGKLALRMRAARSAGSFRNSVNHYLSISCSIAQFV